MRAVEVLIVDDDPSIRKVLPNLLSRSGYGVADAESGDDAIGKLTTTAFDVVITDLVMPGSSGLDVLRYVRGRHPKTPVIMLTAEGSIRDCVAAMRAGAFNFLTKPFQAKDLEDVVRQAVIARGGHAPARRRPRWATKANRRSRWWATRRRCRP